MRKLLVSILASLFIASYTSAWYLLSKHVRVSTRLMWFVFFMNLLGFIGLLGCVGFVGLIVFLGFITFL